MNRLAAVSILIASSASAQVQLSGLRSGYAVDEATRVLRPIVGLPGSAYLGPAVALPFPVTAAAAINGGNALIAVSATEEPEAWLIRDPAGTEPQAHRLAPGDRVFTAIRATAALVYSSRTRTVRLASALDKSPVLGPEINESTLGGNLAAAALDEESGCGYLAVQAGETSIVTLCPERPGEPRTLRTLGTAKISGMIYWRRNGLVLVERAENRASLLRAPVASAVPVILASSESGLADPVGVQTAPGSRIVIVQGEPARIAIGGATGQDPLLFTDLPVPAERLDYLVPDRILAINRVNGSPLVVLDAEQDFAAYFIPPAGEPE